VTRKRRTGWIKIPGVIVLPILVGYALAYVASAEIVQIRVENKSAWPTSYRSRTSFFVYTDRGTFKVGWEPLFLEFAAAERYQSLQKGGVYRVLVAGWHVPFTNLDRRIVKIVD
jgi:hypothetical protein